MITFLTVWLKKHHWLHDWGKWEKKEYAMTYFAKDGPKAGTELFQDRQCSVCGKTESESL